MPPRISYGHIFICWRCNLKLNGVISSESAIQHIGIGFYRK